MCSATATESEITALERVCLAGASMMPDAAERGLYDIAVHEREPTDARDASYWYGEWFGRLIPVPALDGALQAHSSGRTDGLSDNRTFIVSLSEPVVKKTAQAFAAVVQELGFPASTLSTFELVKLGFRTNLNDLECDPDNVEATVRNVSALVARSLSFFQLDEVYLVGENVIVARHTIGDTDRWEYIFVDPNDPDSILLIKYRLDRELYPDFGLRIVEAVSSYPYANAEPQWLREFFESSEKRFKTH